ncbi:sortase (plasmid) [Clostridium perfringens]
MSEPVMKYKKGVGVIDGTSIPIGGESTHSVLSAHTCLTTQKLFTNIDQLGVSP